ncbi:hypothetical protein B5X24_HaOG207836 [Helicoverpa armigera]|uniref:Peptidase S1 domain-containing protein n=1 Tax=Helicoverpa armigera TaxID=29058 RepID=A0A2W1BHA4_HELAM|nr:hypothetical protein B5X24_HaOG207836 [Helicoverpa armigera]
MLKRHIVIVILVIFRLGGTAAEVCDVEVKTVPEGHLGQSSAFKWLGVLQVHIQDFDKRHVALTGIVLIKPKFALANANDVARIPERVFKEDTVAVFIPAEDTPVALSVISFVVHPEYGDSMVHSLAIIELNNTQIKGFSLTPVCLSREHFKKSKTVYLTGFTDEYETLEKVIHKIQTLDNPVCDGFNERRGVSKFYSPDPPPIRS